MERIEPDEGECVEVGSITSFVIDCSSFASAATKGMPEGEKKETVARTASTVSRSVGFDSVRFV
jgi:hypothetical protein